MNKKLIRKMLTAAGGPIKYISDIYLKLSDSPLASTIYDGTNLVLYAAAPFTGGATLIPAMAMTGLQATGASANIYDKGLNFLNGTDIASAIPGFGLLNKGVKLAMKPTMKMVGKTTKRVKNATKYLPKKESHPYTYRRMERVGNSGSRRVIRPVEHTIELGKYRPTFWLLAKEDKKYWPAAALVYGEDAINHGLNTYLVVKDIDLKKQGGKMNILEFLKNGSGIHIKKKNRGSFTRWCGGNVTEECIRRGKASSNPKIRKKATFADNARHFKHEQGGIIKAKEGFKWSDILNNSGLGNLFSLGIQAYSSNKIADNNLLMQDASLEMEKNKELLMVPQLANQMFPQMMGPINPENPNEKGGVYAKYLYGKLESMLNGQINLTYENKKRINRLQTQSLKDLNLMNVLSGVGDTVSSIASYIGNKKNSTTPTTSNYQLDSFWTNPSLS